MKSWSRSGHVAAALTVSAALGGAAALLAACSGSDSPESIGSATTLTTDTGTDWVIETDPDTGTASLAFPRNPTAQVLTGDPAQAAAAFLLKYPAVFGAKAAGDLATDDVEVDEAGVAHVTFTQTANGQPVEDAPIAVHFDLNGGVDHVTGPFYPNLSALVKTPAIATATASATAVAELGKIAAGATVTPGNIGTGVRIDENNPVFVHTVRATVGVTTWEVWVDAMTGAIVRSNRLGHDFTASGQGIQVSRSFEIDDPKSGTYALKRTKTSARPAMAVYAATSEKLITSTDPNTWEASAPIESKGLAVEGYFKFEKILGWWKNTNGWDSFDNKGSGLDLLVGGSEGGPTNAAWTGDHIEINVGTSTVFPSADIDTLGHEFTHAVVQFTAKLPGSNNCDHEYDAMNEGLADVFGELTAAGTVGGDHTVLSDEFGTDEIIRSLEDPSLRKTSPGKNVSKGADHMSVRQGECHYDDGVIDLAWYLMTFGGSHPDAKRNFTLKSAPLGLGDSRKLWWRLLRSELRGSKAIAVMARRTVLAARNLGMPLETPACAWFAVGALSADELKSSFQVTCDTVTDAGTSSDAGAGDAGPIKDSCVGRSDGLYCSEIDTHSGFTCTSGQVSGGNSCPSSQTCVGANPGGTDIVCR